MKALDELWKANEILLTESRVESVQDLIFKGLVPIAMVLLYHETVKFVQKKLGSQLSLLM